MKKKHYKGYVSLKEARAVAREKCSYWYVDIYKESDGSFSVGNSCDRKSEFLMAVDKSGAKFTKKWVNSELFGKRLEYVPMR